MKKPLPQAECLILWIYSIKTYDSNLGMNETVTINGMNVYEMDSNGEYKLNYDAVNSKFNGFDYSKIHKLYAFQSVNDPVIGPTAKTTKELAEFIFREL